MLKTDDETHDRFMRYRSKRHYETGEKKTVTEVLNELLDAAGAERSKKKGDTSG